MKTHPRQGGMATLNHPLSRYVSLSRFDVHFRQVHKKSPAVKRGKEWDRDHLASPPRRI